MFHFWIHGIVATIKLYACVSARRSVLEFFSDSLTLFICCTKPHYIPIWICSIFRLAEWKFIWRMVQHFHNVFSLFFSRFCRHELIIG
uniref:Putative secreted protein n=1 Tax=Panstrongylus lignarius TaxID=156445 RepID=A0A224Y474_9HEMI